MATSAQWIAGARPRTLPAAIAPVLAGTGVVAYAAGPVWWKAALALVVSVALQVGVNYANDYSDGIRGTDDDRVGPVRLTGSRLAAPAAVKRAALISFGVAAGAGLVLALSTAWWLVLVGLLCILAAWFYTGGKRPYGYLGLGEVMVFVFFGLVAVVGTAYVQAAETTRGCATAGNVPSWVIIDRAAGCETAWLAPVVLAGIGIGALACAILVANNLRDIPTDTVAGKRTLAVRLGDRRTRLLYAALVVAALVALVGVAGLTSWWALAGLVFLLPAARATATVLRGAEGPKLILVLARTGVGELLWGLGVFAALLLSR